MPKATFLRLAPEKRERLVAAAYLEFSRVPFNEASISNIIKAAKIPRGSFYQYFEDKADLFFYLLEDLKVQNERLFKVALAKHQGEFFPAVRQVFHTVIDDLVMGERAAFYRNLFLYMDFHSANQIAPTPPKHAMHGNSLTAYLLAHVNRDSLRVHDEADLQMAIRQVFGIFIQTVSYYYNRQGDGTMVTVDELKARLDQMLDWWQYGLQRKDDAHD